MKEIVTIEDLKDIINNETCLIYLYTYFCRISKNMIPVIDSWEVDIPIYKFKIDKNTPSSFFNICKLTETPTIILYKNKKERIRIEKFIYKYELEKIIKRYK